MRNFSLVLLVVYCQQTIYVGGEGGEGGSTSGQEHAFSEADSEVSPVLLNQLFVGSQSDRIHACAGYMSS